MRDALGIIAFASALAALLVPVLILVRGRAFTVRFPALGKPRAKAYWAAAAAVVAVVLFAGGALLFSYPQREASADLDGYAVSGEPPHEVLVEVANVGVGDGVYSESCTVDGVQVADVEADVPSGESAKVRLELPGDLALGAHTLDLGDSTTTFEVVTPAAFVVKKLRASKSVVRAGDRISLGATVRNTGGAPGTYEKAPRLDGKECSGVDRVIAPGETETLLYETANSRAGTHTIRLAGESYKVTAVKPVRLSNEAVIVRPSGGLGRLKIKNGNSEDAMVVLTKPESRKAVASVYIRGKKTALLKGLANGKYGLYYSMGRDWNWHMRDFFAVGERGKFSNPLDYSTSSSSYISGNYRYTNTEYTAFDVSLHAVSGGTARTESVDEAAFPSAR